MPFQHRNVKIVATVGPASRDEATLRALLQAGVDVVRLNFSHGTHEEHAETIARVRRIGHRMGKAIAILQDLQGPKIRVGQLPGGSIMLNPGDTVVLYPQDRPAPERAPVAIPVDFPELPRVAAPTGASCWMTGIWNWW